MKERPILFSAPMVRAILTGTKTQTRRVVKPKVSDWISRMSGDPGEDYAEVSFRYAAHLDDDGKEQPPEWMCFLEDYPEEGCVPIGQCPYGQPGDRLWVRETFAQGFATDELTGEPLQFDAEGNQLPMTTWYRATDTISWSDDDGWETNVPWKPSIHMPRTASRITLEIVSVRVERLQDITLDDAMAEGIVIQPDGGFGLADTTHYNFCDPCESYWSLWESINGAGSVEANPWVWVVEFKRVEGGAA